MTINRSLYRWLAGVRSATEATTDDFDLDWHRRQPPARAVGPRTAALDEKQQDRGRRLGGIPTGRDIGGPAMRD